MTSALLDRPGTPDAPTAAWSAKYTGTLRLLRLYLRRDRIVAPLWILLLSVPLATVYVGSISKVYPTDADRAGMVASIMASPAQRAMYGNIYADNLGALGVWKAGMFHVLIAVAVILTVIRHTRADEEAGRVELLDSTAIGRYAGLTAAPAHPAPSLPSPRCRPMPTPDWYRQSSHLARVRADPRPGNR